MIIKNASLLLTIGTVLILAIPCVGQETTRFAPDKELLQLSINEEDITEAVKAGILFLKSSQNSDGSWGTARNTKALNIYAPVPGAHRAFRSATTALCLSALVQWESEFPEATPLIETGQGWLLKSLPELKRADQTAIYNVWGHAFGIQALVHLWKRTNKQELKSQIAEVIEQQYDYLTRYESVDGGWGYYDFRVGTKRPASSSISFVGATVLIAFNYADNMGLAPPTEVTQRAIAAIQRQQKSDFSYLYGEYLKNRPVHPVNRPGGSLGRSQACNLALKLWGDQKITTEVIDDWLSRLILRNGWLDIGRKRPIPHESWFAVAGYFYYYGHYYAALCLEHASEEKQPIFSSHLIKLMLERQEKDGSWWDYPLYAYHQPYGTGFALQTLYTCRQSLTHEE